MRFRVYTVVDGHRELNFATDDPAEAFDHGSHLRSLAKRHFASWGVLLTDECNPQIERLLDQRAEVFRPESWCPTCQQEHGPERYLPDLSHQLREECESCAACPHDTREEKAGLR